jgi:hypothetical protein
MKTILAILLLSLLPSCARFSTKQTDVSSTAKCGVTTRTITTKATAYTLFTSKSQLTNWKAQQSDKTQGASVGLLSQESLNPIDTNVTAVVTKIVEAAVSAAVKAVKP